MGVQLKRLASADYDDSLGCRVLLVWSESNLEWLAGHLHANEHYATCSFPQWSKQNCFVGEATGQRNLCFALHPWYYLDSFKPSYILHTT
jgi:hypothetical protein